MRKRRCDFCCKVYGSNCSTFYLPWLQTVNNLSFVLIGKGESVCSSSSVYFMLLFRAPDVWTRYSAWWVFLCKNLCTVCQCIIFHDALDQSHGSEGAKQQLFYNTCQQLPNGSKTTISFSLVVIFTNQDISFFTASRPFIYQNNSETAATSFARRFLPSLWSQLNISAPWKYGYYMCIRSSSVQMWVKIA